MDRERECLQQAAQELTERCGTGWKESPASALLGDADVHFLCPAR